MTTPIERKIMLNLQLHVEPKTEKKLHAILNQTKDEESFARNIIAYQIGELEKGILNLRLDLKELEEKHRMTSAEFFQKFSTGVADDREDFILWSGLEEMLRANELKLRELQ